MFIYLFTHICFIILLCILFWNIINITTKQRLKKCIELEGYFERFNDYDKKVRNDLTLNEYIKNCRIRFPWEMPGSTNIIFFDPKHEGSNPHTHGKFIMIPKHSKPSDSIILHEQTHIYQRYNPLEVNRIITKSNPIISMASKIHDRANPDTNCIQYQGFSSKYKNNPNSLTDIVSTSSGDHPYEEMAYSIQK